MTKRILLVDDDRSIRESLSKILRAENYEVVLGENGQEAIEKHGAERIDLLILDLNPDTSGVKNGWTTLERLVGIKPLLPVVIITGRSNQRAQAEAAGADALMEKPLDVPSRTWPYSDRAVAALSYASRVWNLPATRRCSRPIPDVWRASPPPSTSTRAAGENDASAR